MRYTNNKTVLKLIFTNVYAEDLLSKNAFRTYELGCSDLFGHGDGFTTEYTVEDYKVEVSYVNETLTLSTSDVVNIVICDDMAVDVLYAETKGQFIVKNTNKFNPASGMYVSSKDIKILAPISSDIICFATESKHGILIEKDLEAKLLNIVANELTINSKVIAKTGLLDAKKINLSKDAQLSMGSKEFQSEQLSKIIADNIVNNGSLNLINTLLYARSSIIFLEKSIGNVEQSILNSNKMYIAKNVEIAGLNSALILEDNLKVDGNINIANLSLKFNTAEISSSGSINGGTLLTLENNESLHVYGKLIGNNVAINGEIVIALFGGTIIGDKSLNISSSFAAISCGARVASENLQIRSGVYVNVLGITQGYNFSFNALVALEFGNINVPYLQAFNNLEDIRSRLANNIGDSVNFESPDNFNDALSKGWHIIQSNIGIIRILLNTVSAPVATGVTLSVQTISFLNQINYLYNKHSKLDFSLSNASKNEVIDLLLDLKGLLGTGVAFKNGLSNASFSTGNMPISAIVPEVSGIVASSVLPSQHKDSLFAVNKGVDISWMQTEQNYYSSHSGFSAAFSQFEQTAYDQHDTSNRNAYNMSFVAGGTRYHQCNAHAAYLSVQAHKIDFGHETNRKTEQQYKNANFVIDNMSSAEAAALLTGQGRFAEINVTEGISVNCNGNDPLTIPINKRDIGVSQNLSTNADITVNSYNVKSLGLESKQGNINQLGHITTEQNLSLNAAIDINKSRTTARSDVGVIVIQAGNNIDNSSGTISGNKSVDIIAGTINNDASLDMRSSITGDIVKVIATKGSISNTGGLIKGNTFAHASAKVNVENKAIEHDVMAQHDYRRNYLPGEILGGAGNEDTSGFGVVVSADGKVINHASTIGSEAKTYTSGDKGVEGITQHKVYKCEDRNYKHGALNRIYATDESVDFGVATMYGNEIAIVSSNGEVLLKGNDTIAPNGTKISAKGKVVVDGLEVKLTRREKNRKSFGLFGSERDIDEHNIERYSTFQTHGGNIKIVSREEEIIARGVAFINTNSEVKPAAEFYAKKNIVVESKILQHSITQTKVIGLSASVAGVKIGKNKGSLLQKALNLEQSLSSARDLIKSSSLVEAAVNGYSAVDGLKTLINDIQTNGVEGAIKRRLSANMDIQVRSKTKYTYETEGGGGFVGIGKVIMHSEEGNVNLGYDLDTELLDIKGNNFYVHGATLNSQFSQQSQTVTVSQNLSLNPDVGISVSKSKTNKEFSTQRSIKTNKLHLNVKEKFTLDGAIITANELTGKVGVIETKDCIDKTSSKFMSLSASAGGSVAGCIGSSHSQTVGAISKLNVIGGISKDFEAQKHVNHGSAGIVVGEDKINSLLSRPDFVSEQRNLSTFSKEMSFSAATNVNTKNAGYFNIGMESKKQIGVVDVNGFKQLRQNKYNANLVNHSLPSQIEKLESWRLNNLLSDSWLAKSNEYVNNGGDKLLTTKFLGKNNSNVQKSSIRQQLDSLLSKPIDDRIDVNWESNSSNKYAYVDAMGNRQNIANSKKANKNDNKDIPSVVSVKKSVSKDIASTDGVNQVSKHSKVNKNPKRFNGDLKNNTFSNKPRVSRVRQFFKDVLNDADKVQTDYWDVKNTPELKAGNAALVRGVAKGAANTIQPILHPIETVKSIGATAQTAWDGLNEISNIALGVASEKSLQRGKERGRQTIDSLNAIKNASHEQKLELAAEAASTLLFSPIAGAGVVGGYQKVNKWFNPKKLSKGEIVEYLSKVDKIPVEQLGQDLKRVGFELLYANHKDKIYKFGHVHNELRKELPKAVKGILPKPLVNALRKSKDMAKAQLDDVKFMVEIHFDEVSGPHMHIIRNDDHRYDISLNNLTKRLQKENPQMNKDKSIKKSRALKDGHINIPEFTKLNMKAKHEPKI